MMKSRFKLITVTKNKDNIHKLRRIVFLTMIYLGLFLTIGREIVNKVQLLEQKQTLVNELQQDLDMKTETEENLEAEIIKYQQDEVYLAKLARLKFNVSKENEIIFILPEE